MCGCFADVMTCSFTASLFEVGGRREHRCVVHSDERLEEQIRWVDVLAERPGKKVTDHSKLRLLDQNDIKSTYL